LTIIRLIYKNLAKKNFNILEIKLLKNKDYSLDSLMKQLFNIVKNILNQTLIHISFYV